MKGRLDQWGHAAKAAMAKNWLASNWHVFNSWPWKVLKPTLATPFMPLGKKNLLQNVFTLAYEKVPPFSWPRSLGTELWCEVLSIQPPPFSLRDAGSFILLITKSPPVGPQRIVSSPSGSPVYRSPWSSSLVQKLTQDTVTLPSGVFVESLALC